jgi:hypothetical protein
MLLKLNYPGVVAKILPETRVIFWAENIEKH